MKVLNLPEGPEFHTKVLNQYKSQLWRTRRYKSRVASDRQAHLVFAIWHCSTADVQAALEAGADPNGLFYDRLDLLRGRGFARSPAESGAASRKNAAIPAVVGLIRVP